MAPFGATLLVTADENVVQACIDDEVTFDISVSDGFAQDVELTVESDVATVVLDQTTVAPGSDIVATITGLVEAGAYTFKVSVTDGEKTGSSEFTINVIEAPGAAALIQPATGAIDQTLHPLLIWNPGDNVNESFIEVALDQNFENIIDTKTTTFNTYIIITTLAEGTQYFWRVTTTGDCGSATSDVRDFTTAGTATSFCSERGRDVSWIENLCVQ